MVAHSWRRTEVQVGASRTHDAPRDPIAPLPRDSERAQQPEGLTGGSPGTAGTPPAPARAPASPFGTSTQTAWDWFAAERIAIAVSGGAAADLDAAHAILIHLYEKVPTSQALATALERGVSYENLWRDDRFIAAVWTIAANKLTDLRRAASRRRAPKFRRPSSLEPDPDGWHRYPPHFRLVSADADGWVGEDQPVFDVPDSATEVDALVDASELATVSRAIVTQAITRLRPADAVVIAFVYGEYASEVHGDRVDEALAEYLNASCAGVAYQSARSVRPVSRDAARRRLTDARIRLEDTIVALHRHPLLDLVTHVPDGEEPGGENARVNGHSAISLAMRTALVTYLSIVGTRPREVVLEAAHAAVLNAVHPASTPWRYPRDFVGALLAHVRALFVRHQAHLGAATVSVRSGDEPK